MTSGSLYHDDPDYQEWINEISKQCDCCPECSEVPCGGVQCGGFCDMSCRCEDHDEVDCWDEHDIEEDF